MKLEKIEWTDTWWERLDNLSIPRILMIGDSVVRGYKNLFRNEFSEDIALDAFMTSKALDNPDYSRELNYMLEKANYEIIVLNNGLHGFHLSAEEYENYLDKVVDNILIKCPDSKIIISTSTPITEENYPNSLHKTKNSIVLMRNEKVLKIARKKKINCFDAYNIVLGNEKIRTMDGYHYTEEGNILLAKELKKFICQN